MRFFSLARATCKLKVSSFCVVRNNHFTERAVLYQNNNDNDNVIDSDNDNDNFT